MSERNEEIQAPPDPQRTKENRMTKTTQDLRSAAHALRTAANALEAVTAQLRTLSTEIDTHDDLNDPEPAPAWPTAPLVWHDGKVWERCGEWWDGYLWEVTGDGRYVSVVASIHSPDLTNRDSKTREKATRFAREAVPVTLVPTEAWEAWSDPLSNDFEANGMLVAADSLAQEAAR